jgi:hypothetical protein
MIRSQRSSYSHKCCTSKTVEPACQLSVEEPVRRWRWDSALNSAWHTIWELWNNPSQRENCWTLDYKLSLECANFEGDLEMLNFGEMVLEPVWHVVTYWSVEDYLSKIHNEVYIYVCVCVRNITSIIIITICRESGWRSKFLGVCVLVMDENRRQGFGCMFGAFLWILRHLYKQTGYRLHIQCDT